MVEFDLDSTILKGDSPGMNRDAGKCVASVTAKIACLDAFGMYTTRIRCCSGIGIRY